MNTLLRLALVGAFMLAPPAAMAQATRATLVDSARALIDDFNERQSTVLLQRALNPAFGRPDAAWTTGVQMLAQILIRNGQGDEAAAWLRWALRLEPAMQVDSVSFIPALVTAFHAARDFVARTRTGSPPPTRWEWTTASAAGGFGDLLVETTPAHPNPPVQLAVDGVGFLDAGRTRRLAPGSYRIAARAPGAAAVEHTAEVLPGVTTIVTFSIATAVTTLTEANERRAVSLLARIDAQRLGETACGVGFFAGSSLVLTSYRAIRGADALSLQLSGGGRVTGNIRVAAYDVASDLAVLTSPSARTDSLPLATDVAAAPALWSLHFPSCGNSATSARVSLGGVVRDTIRLNDNIVGADQGGVLLTPAAGAAGLALGTRVARSLGGASALLATARRNAAAGSLLALGEVAQRERHAYGEAELRGAQAGARARVSPLESWHWPELGRVATLPFTYRGPMGRYTVELLDGDRVQLRRELVLDPAQRAQLTLGETTVVDRPPVVPPPQPGPRRGMSKKIPIIGGIAAGGVLAAVLLGGGGENGGGGNGGGGGGRGGIVVRLP